MKYYLLFLIFLIPISTYAQITTDGTLGQALNLPGPYYQIGADLGQQHGGNLFHSFQDFNLQPFESATFSGPNHIQNILSRVTGGNPSHINGLFRSTIPNADVYFLNPYGIMFGPNARLDVQGSFHASTADYLRLGENGRFDARNPSESLLTVAPIEAFGFLTDSPAPITIDNSQLEVIENKTLSLVGGHLIMEGDLSSNDESTTFHPDFPVKLYAEFGRINLVSIDSPSEVILKENELILTTNKKGQILVSNTWIGVSGDGGGDIFIRASHVELENSELESDSIDQNGGIINIQVDQLILQGSEIATDTYGIGQGGEVSIRVADTLRLYGISESGSPSFIFSGSEGKIDNAGHAGKIEIQAHQILITENAKISSFTEGTGNGGSIIITAFDHLTIWGNPDSEFGDVISNINTVEGQTNNTGVGGLFTHSRKVEADAGNAGNISIQAATIKLIDHATINASAKNAVGGNIEMTTSNKLYLKEGRITTSVKNGTGDGGDISISHPVFIILDNAKILAHADMGHGGNINIIADQLIASPNSLVSASSKLGLDGKVKINAPEESITEGMLTLSAEMIDVSHLMKKTCETMSYEEYNNRSHFLIHPIAGSPASPYDLQPSPLPQITSSKKNQDSSQKITIHQPRPIPDLQSCALYASVQTKTPEKENRVIPEQLF